MCQKKWSKKVWQKDLSAWVVGFFRSYTWKRPRFFLISQGVSLRFSTLALFRGEHHQAFAWGPWELLLKKSPAFYEGIFVGEKDGCPEKKKSHDIKVLIDDDFMVCFFVFNLVVAGWNPWWTRKIFGLPRWKIFQEDKRFRCGTPKNCVFQVSGPEVCLKSTFCFRL